MCTIVSLLNFILHVMFAASSIWLTLVPSKAGLADQIKKVFGHFFPNFWLLWHKNCPKSYTKKLAYYIEKWPKSSKTIVYKIPKLKLQCVCERPWTTTPCRIHPYLNKNLNVLIQKTICHVIFVLGEKLSSDTQIARLNIDQAHLNQLTSILDICQNS